MMSSALWALSVIGLSPRKVSSEVFGPSARSNGRARGGRDAGRTAGLKIQSTSAELIRREGELYRRGVWLSTSEGRKKEAAKKCARHTPTGVCRATHVADSLRARLRAARGGLVCSPDGRCRRVVGRARVCLARVFEREREYLVNRLDELDGHVRAHLFGHVLQVLLVVLRDEHRRDADAVRREQLLLHAADGEHAPAQGYLARHRNVAAHGHARQGRGHRSRERHARRGAVLRNRALGYVYVEVALAYELKVHAEALGARLDAGERGLRRLLHDFAELARELHPAAAVRERGLYLQDLAADLGPREPQSEPDLRRGRHVRLPEANRAEHLAHDLGRDYHLELFALAVGHELARDLAAARAYLAFEITDAGLARVVADDLLQAVVGELDLLGAEARALGLLLHKVTLRYLQLLALRVAREAEDFESVLQRRRNRVQDVRRRDEEDLREVVLNVEVVILKRVVLLGV